MGQPAESRRLVRHLLNIRRPYSYENPDLRIICQGVTELTETFEAQTNDVQYICETSSTTNVTGYKVSFPLSMGYIKDDPVELWIDWVIKTLPTGAATACDYIRVNTAEEMFGTTNAYIGVRRKGTVQAGSIGGASKDSMTSKVTINGAGDGVVGFITVDNTVPGNPVFTWTATTLEAPIVTSPINRAHVTDANVIVKVAGKPGLYAVVVYGNGTNDKTSPTLIGTNGTCDIPISKTSLGKNAKIAAIVYERSDASGAQSVSSTPVSFTTDAADINPPVITSPTNNATGVALKAGISGTGLENATVTVNSGTGQLGQTTVASDGTWTLQPATPFTASTEYTISATQKIGNSESIPSDSIRFTTANS